MDCRGWSPGSPRIDTGPVSSTSVAGAQQGAHAPELSPACAHGVFRLSASPSPPPVFSATEVITPGTRASAQVWTNPPGSTVCPPGEAASSSALPTTAPPPDTLGRGPTWRAHALSRPRASPRSTPGSQVTPDRPRRHGTATAHRQAALGRGASGAATCPTGPAAGGSTRLSAFGPGGLAATSALPPWSSPWGHAFSHLMHLPFPLPGILTFPSLPGKHPFRPSPRSMPPLHP